MNVLKILLDRRMYTDVGSILQAACWSNNMEVVESILSKEDVYVDLHYLIHDEIDIEIVKLLLSYYNTDVNIKNVFGFTPLHIACYFGNCEIGELLLEHQDIDINVKTINNFTPLHYACYYGHVEMVKLMVNSGKRIEIDAELLLRLYARQELEILRLLIT